MLMFGKEVGLRIDTLIERDDTKYFRDNVVKNTTCTGPSSGMSKYEIKTPENKLCPKWLTF